MVYFAYILPLAIWFQIELKHTKRNIVNLFTRWKRQIKTTTLFFYYKLHHGTIDSIRYTKEEEEKKKVKSYFGNVLCKQSIKMLILVDKHVVSTGIRFCMFCHRCHIPLDENDYYHIAAHCVFVLMMKVLWNTGKKKEEKSAKYHKFLCEIIFK